MALQRMFLVQGTGIIDPTMQWVKFERRIWFSFGITSGVSSLHVIDFFFLIGIGPYLEHAFFPFSL